MLLLLPLLFTLSSALTIDDVLRHGDGVVYTAPDGESWCKVESYHIDDYLTAGRFAFLLESTALQACTNNPDCSGVVYEPTELQYTLRQGQAISESHSGRATTYVKGDCGAPDVAAPRSDPSFPTTTPPPPSEVVSTEPATIPGATATPPDDAYCIEACDSDQKFVNLWARGGGDSLCDTDVVRALRGRGEDERCEHGDWMVVDECKECYEFVWRETTPYQCHVEDRFLWCCDPVISVTGGVMCARSGSPIELVCTAKYNHHNLIKVNWIDAEGNNLAAKSGFSVETYDSDEDKKISILSIGGVGLDYGTLGISCQVTDQTGQQWRETTDLRIFDVEAYDVVQPAGEDTSVVCIGRGLDMTGTEFTLTWQKLMFGEWVKLDYDTVTRSMGERGLYSSLKIPSDTLEIGDQVYQCSLSYRGVTQTACSGVSYSQESSCNARASVTIWELPEIEQCCMVGDTTRATVKIEGSTSDFSVLDDEVSVTEVNELGETIATGDDVEIVKRSVGSRGEVSITVTLNKPTSPSVRYFKTKVFHKGETVEKVNFIFHIEEVTVVELVNDGVQFDARVLLSNKTATNTATADPATLLLQWSDDQGNNLRSDSSDLFHILTANVPGDFMTATVLVTRGSGEGGERCGVVTVETPVQKQECKIQYGGRSCEDRCAAYTQIFDWDCVCKDEEGIFQRAQSTECDKYGLIPETDITYECPATLDFEMSAWVSEECDEAASCYPYRRTKQRTCTCTDSLGTYEDTHGRCSAEGALIETFTCQPANQFELTAWTRGGCPSNTCHSSITLDTRQCVCGEVRDRDACGEEELVRERTCQPTEAFEWTDWGAEVCDKEELCLPKQYNKTRACRCQTLEEEGKCEGESSASYTCPANQKWNLRSIGECPDVESCVVYNETITTRCECSAEGSVLTDRAQCEGQVARAPRPCSPTVPYEWGEWNAMTQCDECFPDRQQHYVRQCACNGPQGGLGEGLCPGPAEKFEPCPVVEGAVWEPSEWSVIQECGALTCAPPETTSIRSRECKCKENVDESQCPDEPLREELGCGFRPFSLSEWSEVVCDRFVCTPDFYTRPKTRTCQCTDTYHGRLEDEGKCDAGEEGYSSEEVCQGESYEWGEWSGLNCPETCLIPTSTKRYRVCECYDRINFDRCNGTAIDFHNCDCYKTD